ncbi:hypothetical protein SAMN05421759_103235 [Roseivivax lentus]|uniref:Uncharacterized protein n=1 Tax=Roseivivax lentus TaxID=633194 RepID=A0A1N7LX73_9RHOB|nr:hypothetical protein [Roseivivax lentus]SIS78423.1 hypothetical protein SAMN05421759_103235 [Roseivivax lentus]
MFHKFAISVLVLGLAGPAVANDDFARTVGVDPGKYTTSELVQIMLSDDKDTEMKMIEVRRQKARDAAAILSTASSTN